METFDDTDTPVVVEEKTLDSKVRNHSIAHADAAVWLGIALIAIFAVGSLIVLIVAFCSGDDPPAWATAVESSTITAALALIFKNHLPSIRQSKP